MFGDPYINIVGIVKNQEPLAYAFSAQALLNRFLDVHLAFLPSLYTELLSDVLVLFEWKTKKAKSTPNSYQDEA